MERFVSIHKASEETGMSYYCLKIMRDRGELPGVYVGHESRCRQFKVNLTRLQEMLGIKDS